MAKTEEKDALKDARHLYEVERRAYHLQRLGFRISELQLSPTQTVPWHFHNKISDTFYVIEGELRLFLQNPKEEVRLSPGQSYAVASRAATSCHQCGRHLDDHFGASGSWRV
jgi:quercetin dioxygenase-like cupin family protein